MPLAGVAGSYRPSQSKKPIGTIKGSKGFNLFPAIAAAFPGALSDVVTEVTEQVAEDAAANAPEATLRRSRSDPEPGTLREAVKVTYRKGKATGDIVSARIDFTAKNPDGHKYAYFVEVGTATEAGRPFLVPAIMRGRQIFNGLVGDLESRLPHG